MFVSFTTFILLTLLAASLLMTPSVYKKSNYLLALLFVLLASQMFMLTLRFWSQNMDAYGLTSIIATAIGPVIYSYVSTVLVGQQFGRNYILRHASLVAIMLIIQWQPLHASVLKDVLVLSSLSFYSIAVQKLILSNQIEQNQHNKTAIRIMRFVKLLAVFLLVMTVLDFIIFFEFLWADTLFSSVGLISAISFLATISLAATFIVLNRNQFVAWMFATKYSPKPAEASDDSGEQEHVIAKLKARVEGGKLYLSSDVSMQVLSEQMEMSSRLISRAINQCLGKSFRRYINDLRIEDAKKMLTDTDDNVLSIMFNVGFESKSNFNSEFYQHVGVSPLAYRKMSRQDT